MRENNQSYRLGWSEMAKDGTKMGVRAGCPKVLDLTAEQSEALADRAHNGCLPLGVPGRYAASGAAPVTPDEAWLPVLGAVGLPAEARLAAHALCQLS